MDQEHIDMFKLSEKVRRARLAPSFSVLSP